MADTSESVRVSRKTARRIRVLARKEQRTITAVIDRAVDTYEKAQKDHATVLMDKTLEVLQ